MFRLFTPDLGLIFWQTVLFIAAFLVLRRYAWGPVLKLISEQEKDYSTTMQALRQAKDKVARAHTRREQLIHEAEKKGEHIMKRAEATKAALLKQAELEAEEVTKQLRAGAAQDIARERVKMAQEVKKQMAGLVLHTTEKMIQRELSGENRQDAVLAQLIMQANNHLAAPSQLSKKRR
jgi:F-type H+-transporting ATPase subunit b